MSGANSAAAAVLNRGGMRVLADITINPDPNFLGMTTIQLLINGLAAIVALALAGFFLFGVGEWNAGRMGGSPWQMSEGKGRMIRAAAGEILVGGAATILNFWWHFGAVHTG